VRPLDQSGDVRQHKREVVTLGHAQVRLQRGERVVANLRRGRRQCRQQARLADVRVANQANVGNRLQLQHNPARFARLALLSHRRRLVRRRDEVDVAESATAATGHHHLVVCLAQIGHQLAVRGDHRAERHQDPDVLAGLAVLLGAGPVAAAPGLKVAAVAELQQRAHAGAGLEVDAAASTAVTAVRAASRHELLAPEAAGAVPAVAGLRKNGGCIDRILDLWLL
jgi:hypothetical protein